ALDTWNCHSGAWARVLPSRLSAPGGRPRPAQAGSVGRSGYNGSLLQNFPYFASRRVTAPVSLSPATGEASISSSTPLISAVAEFSTRGKRTCVSGLILKTVAWRFE